jgi:hypothetical protein
VTFRNLKQSAAFNVETGRRMQAEIAGKCSIHRLTSESEAPKI